MPVMEAIMNTYLYFMWYCFGCCTVLGIFSFVAWREEHRPKKKGKHEL